MDKLKLDAVVHWSIPVNDLAAAEKFYGEILGLEHVGRLANTPMSCFKLGNHNILLCQRRDPISATSGTVLALRRNCQVICRWRNSATSSVCVSIRAMH